MAKDDQQERLLDATPKRREDARRRGEVVHSREVSSAAMLLGGAFCLAWAGSSVVGRGQNAMASFWSRSVSAPMQAHDVYQLILTAMFTGLHALLPVAGVLAAVAIASSLAQHGWVWAPSRLAPKWSALNPTRGLGRLLSVSSLNEFVKALFKFAVIGGVLFVLIRRDFHVMLTLAADDPHHAVGAAISLLSELGVWAGGAIGLVGVADYGFRFWQHEQQLRMTRSEFKEEAKQSEGSPMLKNRIRSLQRDRARKRMMADVPKADVVITNPTELAVAMVYRHGEMAAPKVVAKGAGLIAQRIREVAREHGVPLVENKPLTRALFAAVDVGELVPSQFYRAVAEILAYVYRLKGKV